MSGFNSNNATYGAAGLGPLGAGFGFAPSSWGPYIQQGVTGAGTGAASGMATGGIPGAIIGGVAGLGTGLYGAYNQQRLQGMAQQQAGVQADQAGGQIRAGATSMLGPGGAAAGAESMGRNQAMMGDNSFQTAFGQQMQQSQQQAQAMRQLMMLYGMMRSPSGASGYMGMYGMSPYMMGYGGGYGMGYGGFM